VSERVDFVIIGGVAVSLHGSAYVTEDLDLAYRHERENIACLVRALSPLNPKLRVPGHKDGIAFPFDERTIYHGGNFTLTTSAGDVDILAHIGGFANYDEIVGLSHVLNIGDNGVRVLSLKGLIRAKKASNRIKDQLVLPELEVLLEAEKRAKELE
jgi:hypothetical protein